MVPYSKCGGQSQGTGKAVEKAGDFYAEQAGELRREAIATVEAAQKVAIAEMEKARLAAEAHLAKLEAEQKARQEASVSSPKTGDVPPSE